MSPLGPSQPPHGSTMHGLELPMFDAERSTVRPGLRTNGVPDGHVSRRRFLQLMGAAMALGGAACTAPPHEKIVPYVRAPEVLVPGKPLFYATAAVLGGYGEGILVESHLGRPTKVEGNPDHPSSLGATGVFAQASPLTLYDPARARTVTNQGRTTSRESFLVELRRTLAQQAGVQGAGLRFLTETVTSPTLIGQMQGLLTQYPQAVWHQYDPLHRNNVLDGAVLAFGQPVEVRYHFERADLVVGLDADALDWIPGHVRYRRDVGARRQPDGPLSRIYAIESAPSILGASADHRLAMRSGDIEPLARALAAALGVDVGADRGSIPSGVPGNWLDALAADLREHPGASIITVGTGQPPIVHAIAHAINDRLGNVGKTVEYTAPVAAAPSGERASLAALTDDMRAGRVQLLAILGGNPVYSAPADSGFTEALTSVPFSVRLGLYEDETSARCQWHVPEAHPLEAWGDVRAYDGTVSIVQPLIAPLYGGRSVSELLAAFSNQPERGAHDLVKSAWQAQRTAGNFEQFWQQTLHAGLVAETALPPISVSLRGDWAASTASSATAPAQDGNTVEIVFRPDPTAYDGSYAGNAWLQELPKPMTALTWDNALMLAPATAEHFGLTDGDVVEIQVSGNSVDAPIMVVPGHAEGSATVTLGYGRTRGAGAANGAGFSAYAIRSAASPWLVPAAQLRKTGRTYPLAVTKEHHRMEGRDIARSGTLPEYQADPASVAKSTTEHSGESILPGFAYPGYAWGMAIDLNACLGCQACVMACQAENNSPVVGKEEVLRGREMHWLRVDSYIRGTGPEQEPDPEAARLHQPVPCMHCENAPCELVCPVAATVHSSEGLNDMVYNRCVGTRYCSNNCPYKVRRFNFLEFADFETESLKPLRNPDVTVRSRGVMEKCTYCVQRINSARITAEKENRPIRDGEILTACQAVCPTSAIVFGNINDPSSRVSQMKASDRNYALLAELNTRPRTTYLAAVRNPNPALEQA
ncbi:MAG: 4Fe-4S dicluster domain-containing protein [Chloroflexota bacterium]